MVRAQVAACVAGIGSFLAASGRPDSCRRIARVARRGLLALGIAFGLAPSGNVGAAAPRQEFVVAAEKPGTIPASPRTDLTTADNLWSTGDCSNGSFLPGGYGGVVPGDVDTKWVSLEQQARLQASVVFDNAAAPPRGVIRALMFLNLVQAINDVHAGTATDDEAAWVTGFQGVVKWGREFIAIEATKRWAVWSNSSAYQATIANNVVQLFFGALGLPWHNEAYVPSTNELLEQAETSLWGPPTTTVNAGNLWQNLPLGTAESAFAMEEMTQALAFINAMGQTLKLGGDPTKNTFAGLEDALGQMSSHEMAEALVRVTELGNILYSGEGGMDHAGIFIALTKSVWTAADTVATIDQLQKELDKAASETPDLVAALGDATQFAELVNDFVAITLHSLPNAGATGNQPDCGSGSPAISASAPAPDATFTVSHFKFTAPLTPDYTYTTQTLGGNTPGTIGVTAPPANTVNDPSVLDWSFSRDVGPGATRVGANWSVSEISYGVPGPQPNGGYSTITASTFYPATGYWYITFTGGNGTAYTTQPLHVHKDASAIHPTDSEVAQAIVDADPGDFGAYTPPPSCTAAPHGSSTDPALNPDDVANYPCMDWDPYDHTGTMLIVRGNQPDGNGRPVMDYQVIFDILVKGDNDNDWKPVFVGHGGQGPGTSHVCGASDGGVCVFSLLGFPLAGDVVESKVLWPRQLNDVCDNADPVTCKGGTLPLHGWPNPYPVDRECQTVSPANGRFAIDYVSTVNPGNPAGSCNNAPGDSWQVTPNIRYRSIDGGLWTAWRSPLYLGTWNFLNIQQAQRQSGNAGIVEIPDPSEQGHNARQLAGSGTHWTADFHAGDNIMLVDPVNGQRNRIGGLVSVIRTVNAVIDDTTLNLNSSVECVSGTDGNDCVMFSTVGYNSFMNPADGVDGNGNGMIVNCTGPSCVSPQTYPFEIYKLTALNPGTTCGTWDPATDPHPPASGCYYSDSIQFQSQTYASDGESRWWNVSLPARGAHTPIANKANASTNALEPWLDQPAVTMQPESVLVSAGSNVSFTTAATGTPAPTVQWQQSADSGLTWNNIAGATNTTYSLNGVTQGQNGMGYRAVFTNANGSRITHSASLGINAAPQITLSPVSIPLAQPGDLVEFTSSASGAPEPAPMWQLSINGGVTWSDLGGATSKLSLIAPPSGPRLYVRVVYTNASGSATSQIAFVATDDVFNSGFEPPAGP